MRSLIELNGQEVCERLGRVVMPAVTCVDNGDGGAHDILYMTRVQRERFFNEADYIRLKDSYILTLDKLETAKKMQEMIQFHAFPCQNMVNDDAVCNRINLHAHSTSIS